MDDNRPKERKRNVTGTSGPLQKKGSGTGSGPVGRGGSGSGSSSNMKRAAAVGGGGVSIVAIIIAIIMSMSGGGGVSSVTDGLSGITSNTGNTSESYPQYTGGVVSKAGDEIKIVSSVNSRVVSNDPGVKADTSVAGGSRAKRTVFAGNGKDKITIMIYMCGTDLESKSSMATADLREMASAALSDNINIIVYTGGCNSWKISGISSKVNQIFQVKQGKLVCLEPDMGSGAMTDPANLTGFIKYCSEKYPADRFELIMWDHGGGSVSGYGYDEKNTSGGSMSLAGVNSALKNAGVTFDFIGFDACLMATAETALMLDPYADYLIASEETEPGIGWYYTNWLNALSENTSMPTVELGKMIVDDFVATCASKCKGQKTTLSVIDLAEFANTVPDNLSAFSESISSILTNKDYARVSEARNDTREFATSSKIDQVDLIDLAKNMGTGEGKKLVTALEGAVKYNRTSSNMSNAGGVSIYFPYKRTNYVDKACSTYDNIGMSEEYSRCIKQVAALTSSGKIATQSSASGASLLGSLFGFGRNIPSADEPTGDYMKDNPLSEQDTADMIAANTFDVSFLKWIEEDGKYMIGMPEEQWSLIYLADKRVFYDDGKGYLDLGFDNVYSWDDQKRLVAETDDVWLAINDQVVPYCHTDTIEDGDRYSMYGYVPARLNGDRIKLLVVFDNDRPDGYIAGYTFAYDEKVNETAAKAAESLNEGDVLTFYCDYYNYEGEYVDNYQLGEPLTVGKELKVSDLVLEGAKTQIMYCFTDLFGQEYYTEVIGH